jgi:hypothetical protein
MRFMVIRKADVNTEAGAPPTEKILDAMGRYNEEMVNAGVMHFGEGLRPSSQGARVKFTRGKPTVTDGPFTETKELVAGFSLIEVDSLDEAIAWAKRWPAFDSEENVELEIRPLYELSDFGTGAAVERHARLRDRMGR